MSAKKRFYKSVALATHDGGFSVQLDGRKLRSPAGRPLNLPKFALADAEIGVLCNFGMDEKYPKLELHYHDI